MLIILLVIGSVLMVVATYMLFYEKFCTIGLPIGKINVAIKKETEAANFYWKDWYVVCAAYNFSVGKEFVCKKIGPDERSSWFDNEREAHCFAGKLKLIRTSKKNIFGRHVLVSKLTPHRRQHYIAVLLSGLLLMMVSVFIIILIGL